MDNALEFLNSLDHDLTEVRILTKNRYCQINGKQEFVGNIISGYYTPDNYEKLVTDIQPFNKNKSIIGIYVTLQDIDIALEARASNRLEYNAQYTTSDTNVNNYFVFPIDIDSNNPVGTSASERELAESKERATAVSELLTKNGIPHEKGMSGNGWHILIYIYKLECSEENIDRVKALGDLVAHHYGSDVKNYNPARVWKLYGTWAGKGDDIPGRPHREAKIYLNGEVERIDFDTLESKLNSILTPIPAEEKSKSTYTPSRNSKIEVTLEEWLDRHNITYAKKPYKGTFKYQVDCPHDPTHKSPDAWVTDEGGAWQFSCSHNSCKNRSTWQDFKDALGIISTPKKMNGGQPTIPEFQNLVGTEIPTPAKTENPLEIPVFPDTEGELFLGTTEYFYRAYQKTDTIPASYLMAMALTEASVAIGRKACVSLGTKTSKRRRVYPNTYNALVGNTFVSGKSDVLEFIQDDILDTEDEELITLPNINSSEGLVKALRNDGNEGSLAFESGDFPEGNRAFICIDEMRNLFINSQRNSTKSIVPMLNDLWRCPRQARLTNVTNAAIAHYPVINLIGAMTYDCLENSVTSSEVLNGFINRFMFWVYEWKDTAPDPEDPDAGLLESWIRCLKSLRNSESFRNFVLDKEAWRDYSEKLDKIRKTAYNNPEDMVSNANTRQCINALKIALILALVENPVQTDVISVEVWHAAWQISEYIAATNRYLFANINADQKSKEEQRILEKLALLGNDTTRRELRDKIGGGNMSTDTFNKSLEALLANEDIILVGSHPQRIIRVS